MRKISLRYIVCALMCMGIISVWGQEKFDEQLVAITQMTPDQAIYQLEQYQLAHPWFAGVYYHLGKKNEELMYNIHPILNYDYLGRVLYNARVYYGNCLHYAQNTSLKDEDFVGIPKRGNHIDYEDIARFTNKKMEHVKQIKTRVDNLYKNYYRMVERYNACRRMFTDFCEQYPGEKQAHLQLQAQDITLLYHLATQFDSLHVDIQAFKNALAEYPIEQYQPIFVYQDIRLYRLDGLTHTNFMASTIPLWNYGAFAKQFLKKQHEDYAAYYQTIQQEYEQIGNAVEAVKKGEKLPIKTNKILTNYINKMDYASFMVPLTQIQQICADMIHCHANELLAENDSTLVVEDIELALNTLYEHDQNRVAARQQLSVLGVRLTEKELSKYQQILRADTTKEAILALAEERLHVADSIYEKIAEDFYLTINKTITPFEKYRDALNDIIIFAHQLPQGEAEIVNMLPLSEGYLVVYADGLFYVVNSQLEVIRQFEHKQHVPIKAVYKIAGDKIAVISPTYTFFIDNQGTAK